jgi:release factor glutamine methyltransferase
MTAGRTIAALLRRAATQLGATSDTPALDAQLLLAHTLRISRSDVQAFGEREVTPAEEAEFAALLARRAQGESVAYLIGSKEFWSLPLEVTADVLVPRPETELVVERALALAAPASIDALDLGTGSGAIALALARERPAWRIVATDVSAAALAIARRNARRLGLANIEFREGSWFDPVRERSFDLVVANPPYVAVNDPALDAPELRREPRIALTPGPDALAALRLIVAQAPAHLRSGGHIVLEHGAAQAQDVAALLVARGFGHVRLHRDLAGNERVIEARRP